MGLFDTIDWETLLNIIQRDIKDERFLKLLREMLQAGYLQDWKYHRTYSGTPQGNGASPVLANILLNELDRFVETELMPLYNRGKRRRLHPTYQHLTYEMRQAKAAGDRVRFQQLKQERQHTPSLDPYDPTYRRLTYIRYCDDFLLGFSGSHQEALEIKHKIQEFLATLKLTLSEEKTLITHAAQGRARFLGYDLSVGRDDTKLTSHKNRAKRTLRSLNGKIILSVPEKSPDNGNIASLNRVNPNSVPNCSIAQTTKSSRPMAQNFRAWSTTTPWPTMSQLNFTRSSFTINNL